ncbi:MAG: lectin-like domain-containing protein, partial [Planktothrix sp.]
MRTPPPTPTPTPTPEPNGAGALRLTSDNVNEAGFVVYNTPIDSTSGLTILFDYYSYGGTADTTGNEGDGLSFFLIDGDKSPTKAGAFGGSLGYAQNRFTSANGIAGGYIGIGFDEYGNFATQVNSSNIPIRADGSATPVRDSITIRGKEILDASNKQDLDKSYPLIKTYDSTEILTKTGVTSIDGPDGAANRTDAGVKRQVGIQLSPQGLLSLFFDKPEDGKLVGNGVGDAGEYVFQNLNIATYNKDTLPDNFKFGFAASTGGSATNIHEISNLQVLTLGSPPVVDLNGGTTDITDETTTLYTTTFTEGNSPVYIASNIATVSDPDGIDPKQDIISLTLGISGILSDVDSEFLTIGGIQFPPNLTQTATVGATSLTVKYDSTTKLVT